MTHPLCALAREFVHGEITPAVETNIKWDSLLECFVAWLRFEGEQYDYDKSTLSHWLTSAIKGEGMFRSKANLRNARFFLGSPADFLADLKEPVS